MKGPQRLKFFGALGALTGLMIGVCVGTVYVISYVLPLVGGGQICVGSECYAIAITINGEPARFVPMLQVEALVVTFFVAFSATTVFWFALKDAVERYFPIVGTLPPRERKRQARTKTKTKEVNP